MDLGFSVIHPHIRLFLWMNQWILHIHPHLGLFLWMNLGFSVIHPHIRLFLWMNQWILHIHPHLRLFLWMNLGFSGIHPHLGLFLWMDLGFSVIHPHIRLFLWINLGFSAIHPHLGPFLWRNLGFSTSMLLTQKSIGSLGKHKSSRFFFGGSNRHSWICFTHLRASNILALLVTYRKNDFLVGHFYVSAIHSISMSQVGRQTLPMTITVGMAGKRLANRSSTS